MNIIFGFFWLGLAIVFQATDYESGYWPALVIANVWFATQCILSQRHNQTKMMGE